MNEENNNQYSVNDSDPAGGFNQSADGGGSKILIAVLFVAIAILLGLLIWQIYAAGKLRQEVEELQADRSELDDMAEEKEEMEEVEVTPETPESDLACVQTDSARVEVIEELTEVWPELETNCRSGRR